MLAQLKRGEFPENQRFFVAPAFGHLPYWWGRREIAPSVWIESLVLEKPSVLFFARRLANHAHSFAA